MENFKKKFIEEATDLIDSLERTLLSLEENPEDKTIIQQVFRIMHTLKGNSGMFGFDSIDSFTHQMETLYDLIRNGEKEVTRDILDLTLSAVDHLKELLSDEEMSNPNLQKIHKQLLKRVASFIGENPTEKDSASEVSTETVSEADEVEQEGNTYYILFDPHKEIFNNGTNPLFLLDELHSLGEVKVLAYLNRVPSLKSIQPTSCYTYWEILLHTHEDVNSINDVFIFVEDEATIEIQQVYNGNLLAEKHFIEELQRYDNLETDFGIVQLQNLIRQTKSRNIKERLVTAVTQARTQVKDTSISSIRVSSDKLDMLMNLVSELVTTQAHLSLFAEENSVPGMMPIAENVQKLSRQLRDIAFSIVLIPIENMLTRFQRLVRDLSLELGKEVAFITEGAETELDKTIIENLADPLMHILRNSLDHGIESAEERIRKGKPKQGKITLKAYYSGANVMIQISDDGAGIDPQMITQKAIAKGIISEDRKLTEREVLDLVFLPGFSTARLVTDLSGRGVGMDVVKRKIADIRGEVEIESTFGVGTTITIKLPLTLSIIDGLLVKIDDSRYIIPLSVVEKIYAIEHEKVVKTFNNVMVLDGKQIPFFYVRREFNYPEVDASHEQVIVVNFEEKVVGLVVDEVIGEYQAVLKPLGKHYRKQDMISGATILGDGSVALVMDTNKIIKLFAHLEDFQIDESRKMNKK